MSETIAEYSAAAIASAIVANHWQFYNIYARQPEVQAHTDVGMLWLSSSIPITYLNHVMQTSLADNALEERIEAMLAHYRSCHVGQFIWRTWPDTRPASLGKRLLARGFTPRDRIPNMAADLSQLPAATPLPPGVIIKPVSDVAELVCWSGVVQAVYQTERRFADFLMRAFHGELANRATMVRHYLAWQDGQAVGCATMFLSAGVAGIYRVAALPSVRRQGVGSAVMRAALRDAQAAGYRFATLRSSEMAHQLYQQLGFHDEFYTTSYTSPALE